jgi:hypothetical protein
LEIAIGSLGICILGANVLSPPRATFLEVTDHSDPAHPKVILSQPRVPTPRKFPGPAAYETEMMSGSPTPPYQVDAGVGVNWPAFWWQNGILSLLTASWAIAFHFIHREMPIAPIGGFEVNASKPVPPLTRHRQQPNS